MPAEPFLSPGRDTDPGWVRGRTQAEIDRELVAWADAPMWGEHPTSGPATEVLPVVVLPAQDSPTTRYGWLYRAPVPPGHLVASGRPAGQDPVLSGAPAAGISETATRTRQVSLTDTLLGHPTAAARTPGARSAATRQVGSGPTGTAIPTARSARRRPLGVLATVVVLALCFGVGGGAALIAFGGVPPVGQSAAGATEQTRGPAPGEVWSGAVATIDGVTATSDCMAPPATDAGGNEVTYEAGHTTDGDPSTAWRCDESTGVEITFTVPEQAEIASVGLINGYAKTDPSDGSPRYGEYRRILTATWLLPDGSTIDQELTDGELGLQELRVPLTHGGPVTLTVARVTNPGSAAATRDAVLISEVRFAGPTS